MCDGMRDFETRELISDLFTITKWYEERLSALEEVAGVASAIRPELPSEKRKRELTEYYKKREEEQAKKKREWLAELEANMDNPAWREEQHRKARNTLWRYWYI